MSSDSESDIEIVLEDPAENAMEKEPIIPKVALPIPKIDANAPAAPAVEVKVGLDIDIIGQHEGVDIIDISMESFEDKPWRKPGADLTDYFNFGFNEKSWREYSDKQKMIRDDLSSHQKRRYGFDKDMQSMPQDFGRHDNEGGGHSKYQRTDVRKGKRSRDEEDQRSDYETSKRSGRNERRSISPDRKEKKSPRRSNNRGGRRERSRSPSRDRRRR